MENTQGFSVCGGGKKKSMFYKKKVLNTYTQHGCNWLNLAERSNDTHIHKEQRRKKKICRLPMTRLILRYDNETASDLTCCGDQKNNRTGLDSETASLVAGASTRWVKLASVSDRVEGWAGRSTGDILPSPGKCMQVVVKHTLKTLTFVYVRPGQTTARGPHMARWAF